MKKLFASVNYSFTNFYDNLTVSGQMIFSIIVFLIIILCILLFITYVYQSMRNKKAIKNLQEENIKIVSKHKKEVVEEKKVVKTKEAELDNKSEVESIANAISDAIKEDSPVSLTDFEEDQERTAIISIEELYEKARELEIIDDEDDNVNYIEKYNLEPSEVETYNKVVNGKEKKQGEGEVKAFRVSQVISPIYGVKKEVINDNKK